MHITPFVYDLNLLKSYNKQTGSSGSTYNPSYLEDRLGGIMVSDQPWLEIHETPLQSASGCIQQCSPVIPAT
jgi:hypothetical protein